MTAFPHLVSGGTFARLLYNIFQHNSKASLEKKRISFYLPPTARKLQQEHIRHMKMVCCSTLLVSSGVFLDIILSRN